MSALKSVSPEKAVELMRAGAVLIDIREADENARERIPGARHHALTQIDKNAPVRPGDDVLIFHCRSGARTRTNAPKLAAAAPACETYILDGGIEAWKTAGLPVAFDRRQPIDLMRQMQIVAGSFALFGVLLGAWVAPGFYILAGLIGAGMIFAGISGICPMVNLLKLMPWNRRVHASQK